MTVLVIDTALGACSAGLFDGTRRLAGKALPMAKGHSERLGGMARDVLAGQDRSAIERIGVTVGPGSFTGLRVGLAFALGLGEALDRPVIGLSTLQALACSIQADGPVIAAIDARRGQVYLQRFQDGRPIDEPRALSVAEATGLVASMPTAGVVGSGSALIAGGATGRVDDLVAPLLEALAALTLAADPATAPPRPLYLRAPDATPSTRLPGQARAPSPR